jgi:hypothetical protein
MGEFDDALDQVSNAFEMISDSVKPVLIKGLKAVDAMKNSDAGNKITAPFYDMGIDMHNKVYDMSVIANERRYSASLCRSHELGFISTVAGGAGVIAALPFYAARSSGARPFKVAVILTAPAAWAYTKLVQYKWENPRN